MNPSIEIKKSKKRNHFLDIQIRNHLLLEVISSQIYQQYKELELTISQLPVLIMDVFERVHSKDNLSNEERNTITKSVILKLYPLMKSGNPLNKDNLKLNDIEVIDDSQVDEDIIKLINNLVDCFSTLKSKPLIRRKGFLRWIFRTLKKLW